jgi:hypothetical protein
MIVAAELWTPLDEATGIPLPIMPRDDLPSVPTGRQRNIERIADWHHPFHPRAELMADGDSGMAVRGCRVQWAEYDDHHHKYHGAFVGPQLPESEEERFRTVVLAAAGYVPAQAIAFDSYGQPEIRRLSEEGREQLWQTGQLRVDNFSNVRKFLINYALKDFGDLRSGTIDEFLHTPDTERRFQLGSDFLGRAAHGAVVPLKGVYRESRELGLIPSEQARSAGRFVFNVMTTYRRKQALGALTVKLQEAA